MLPLQIWALAASGTEAVSAIAKKTRRARFAAERRPDTRDVLMQEDMKTPLRQNRPRDGRFVELPNPPTIAPLGVFRNFLLPGYDVLFENLRVGVRRSHFGKKRWHLARGHVAL